MRLVAQAGSDVAFARQYEVIVTVLAIGIPAFLVLMIVVIWWALVANRQRYDDSN